MSPRQNRGKKKTPRRHLALLCLLVVASLFLGGCGGQTGQTVRVGSLKGPTSLGILALMDRASKEETQVSYQFQMAASAEELLPLLAKGELDIALIPANVAAVLYQKTQGGVAVIDVNTLGVLYLVTGDPDIASVEDLKGRTVYLTGKGAAPDACLRYILSGNGFGEGDCALEYKSEPTEVAALLAEDPAAVGLLPQPFATAALMRSEALGIALDMNEEWERLQGGEAGGMVTGVTVVRRAFLEEHPEAVEAFLRDHLDSVAAVNKDPQAGARLAVEAGIVAKEDVAERAIPECNLVCVTGEKMKNSLYAYLKILNDFDPELIGGSLPGEDFYYIDPAFP